MPVAGGPPSIAAATVARVAPAAVAGNSFTLLAANAGRNGVILHNDTTGTLSVRYGAGATATDFTVRVAADGYWEMPPAVFAGTLTASCTVITGGVQVTEM